jgi:hypothetical protein
MISGSLVQGLDARTRQGDGAARRWTDGAQLVRCQRHASDEESCGEIFTRSFSAAIADLKTRYGDDPSKWRWGTAHYAKGGHRPFGEVDLLRRVFNVEVESSGGPFTLDRGYTQFTMMTIPTPTPTPRAIAGFSISVISTARPTFRPPANRGMCSPATTATSPGSGPMCSRSKFPQLASRNRMASGPSVRGNELK